MAGFDIGSVVAHIKADVTDFKDKMGQAQSSVDGLKGGFSSFMGTASKVAIGLGAVGAAVGVVGGFIVKDLVGAASEAEVEMAKVNALLKKTGMNFDTTSKAVAETSKAFIKLGFDDEETSVAMAKSLAVTKDVTESQKEMALAADFARLQGIGIGESQKLLQMAYMGNARVLKQYGIELEDGATKQDIFNKIQEKAGGQAQAYSQTYKGAMETLNVEITNVKETLGAMFIPMLIQAIQFIGNIIAQVQAWADSAGSLSGIWQQAIGILQPLFAWFTATILPQLQSIWAEFMYFINMVVPPFMAILQFLLGFVVEVFLKPLVNFWLEHWTQIQGIVQGAWEIISGIFQVFSNIVLGVVAVLLNLLAGNWKAAFEALQHYTSGAWDGIKNIFGGVIDFLWNFGKTAFDALVSPFRAAWDEIKNLVNRIKDALDPNKRHSPSLVDRVKKGVDDLNRAWEGLNPNMIINTPHAPALAPASAGMANNITIDMNGALIGDAASATRLGEMVGDSIIRKLKMNVRF